MQSGSSTPFSDATSNIAGVQSMSHRIKNIFDNSPELTDVSLSTTSSKEGHGVPRPPCTHCWGNWQPKNSQLPSNTSSSCAQLGSVQTLAILILGLPSVIKEKADWVSVHSAWGVFARYSTFLEVDGRHHGWFAGCIHLLGWYLYRVGNRERTFIISRPWAMPCIISTNGKQKWVGAGGV